MLDMAVAAGWLSTILLSLTGLVYLLVTPRTRPLNIFFWVWLVGEVLGLVYTISIRDVPLAVNYLFNTLCLLLTVWLRYKRRAIR